MSVRDSKTARMGKEIIPFEMDYLPEFFQKKAVVELNDTPENRVNGLKVLKELMENNWNPEEFTIENVKRMAVLTFAQALRCPMTQVNGFKVIYDMKSNPIRHIRYFTPSNVYLLYHGSQECTPGRFKAVHVVNMSLTGKVLLETLKFFISDKLKKRIHLHEDPKELLEHFPAAVLPVEYGGELGDYDLTDWLRRVISDEHVTVLSGENQPAS